MAIQKEVAKHLDMTTRQVRNLVSSGVLPPAKPGGYDIESCRVAYIRYLRGIKSGQVKTHREENEDDGNYRELLEKEKYREKRRVNDLEEDIIAPVTKITSAISRTIEQITPIFDSLPLEMKRMNPKLTGHDIQLVKKSIAKIRNIVANTKIDLNAD